MVQMVQTKSRCRVGVFAHDTPSDTRDQFGDRAALRVLVGKLKNRGALPRDGFSQTSPIWIAVRSGSTCGSGCDMRNNSASLCSETQS